MKEYVGIKQATRGGYILCEVGGVADFLYPTSKHRRGRVQGNGQICPTITAENTGVCKVEKNYLIAPDEQIADKMRENLKKLDEENEYYEQLFGDDSERYKEKDTKVDWSKVDYRIRKLTAKECYRLMDVPEDMADKMLAVNSNTQCYKQAGNSIVVSVLCAIFSQLNIKGIKPWNERTLKEKYDLVANPKAHI